MRFKLRDGMELFYTIDDFTDPWTEPETVILHHGMAKSHRMWFGWTPILARHYRVVRMDMRGMGDSERVKPGFKWSLDSYADDILQLTDGLGLDKFHLVGETVGGTISMRFATLHQERLLSLTTCTSPTNFANPQSNVIAAELIEREGIRAWVEDTISRRMDPLIVDPAYTRWYIDQMASTDPAVVMAFEGSADAMPDLRPLLKDVQIPVLIMAAENIEGEFLGDFRQASDIFPNGRRVVFPGVRGFVQHILPAPCARTWLAFARSLSG